MDKSRQAVTSYAEYIGENVIEANIETVGVNKVGLVGMAID